MNNHVHCRICRESLRPQDAYYLDWRCDRGHPVTLGPYCSRHSFDLVEYINQREGGERMPLPPSR